MFMKGQDTKTKFLTIVAAAALLFGVPQFIWSQNAPDSTDILNRPSEGVQLSNATTPDILAQALTNAGVPGGIAVRNNCGGFERRFLSPSKKTLRGVLDAVSSADPEYSWNVDRGVVNFVPRDNEPRLLNTLVSKLEVRSAEPNQALSQLLALPEVAKAARGELGFQTVTGGPYAFMMDGSQPERQKVSLSLTNVTVREALNAIARSHGTAVWILVRQDDCGPNNARKFFDLHFISR
jgi:hypothetical protein